MFTGIITDIGKVRAVRDTDRDRRFEIETRFDLTTIDIGASIAHAGCCLTVVEKGPDWFAVEVSGETLDKTTLGGWTTGYRVNLERSARVGDELGGHIVSGHVDGVGEVVSVRAEGGSHRVQIRVFRAETEIPSFARRLDHLGRHNPGRAETWFAGQSGDRHAGALSRALARNRLKAGRRSPSAVAGIQDARPEAARPRGRGAVLQ